MTEYAVLVAHTGLSSVQSFARTAELWLSRVNWELAGYIGLFLIALRIASSALRHR